MEKARVSPGKQMTEILEFARKEEVTATMSYKEAYEIQREVTEIFLTEHIALGGRVITESLLSKVRELK